MRKSSFAKQVSELESEYGSAISSEDLDRRRKFGRQSHNNVCREWFQSSGGSEEEKEKRSVILRGKVSLCQFVCLAKVLLFFLDSVVRPEALLAWLADQTASYDGATVSDLGPSFCSGIALCAIIHRYRPDLLDFRQLNRETAAENNQRAFDLLQKEYGIVPVSA